MKLYGDKMKSGLYFWAIVLMGLSLAILAGCNYPTQNPNSGLAITITEPADGDEFVLGERITIQSSLTYSGVDFWLMLLVNDTIHTVDTAAAPYNVSSFGFNYEPEEPGEYTFQTILEDAQGETAISNIVTVTVFESIEIPGIVVKGTPTFTGEAPSATANEDATCWSGPGPEYKQVDRLTEGQTARLVGVKADKSWFVVEGPETKRHCWVQAHQVTINVDPEGLPTVEAPPQLVDTPTSTRAPTKKPKPTETEEPSPEYKSCSDYPDFSTCNNDPMGFGGCSWDTGFNQCQP